MDEALLSEYPKFTA